MSAPSENELTVAISAVSAAMTTIAAFAAAVSAWASSKAAKESERARIQSAQPYLRIDIKEPWFTIAWRPSEGEPPRAYGGWLSGFTLPSGTMPTLVLLNFGGGPALDVRVAVRLLQTAGPIEFERRNLDGIPTAHLLVADNTFTAAYSSFKAPVTGRIQTELWHKVQS